MAEFDLNKVPVDQRAKVACRMIMTQFPSFPEGRLMGAVVCGAITDLNISILSGEETALLRRKAMTYLNGPMKHAELAGVEPEWIRLIMKRVGLDFTTGA